MKARVAVLQSRRGWITLGLPKPSQSPQPRGSRTGQDDGQQPEDVDPFQLKTFSDPTRSDVKGRSSVEGHQRTFVLQKSSQETAKRKIQTDKRWKLFSPLSHLSKPDLCELKWERPAETSFVEY